MGELTRRGDRRKNSRRRLTRNALRRRPRKREQRKRRRKRRRNKLLSSSSPPTSSFTESITRGAMRIKSDYWHMILQPKFVGTDPLKDTGYRPNFWRSS